MATLLVVPGMTEPVEGVVTRYLDHLVVRNLRPWTVYNRQCALRRLTRWAGSPILHLTESDLRRWQEDRSRQIQPEPRRSEMSHVRQFFRWAVRDGYLTVDPMLRIELPRVARHLPRPIADKHLAHAMANADTATRVILALAAFAGLRACEVAQLDWSEIGLLDDSPHLRVIDGKGGHGRLVPMSHALMAELEELPARRGPVIRRLDGNPGPCKAHRISSRANNYLHSMGVAETLHQCRHRFASVTYQACQDIRAVQDLLGHASPTTTAVYAASASQVAINAVEAAGAFHHAA
jgi:site-specific recombinase XerC